MIENEPHKKKYGKLFLEKKNLQLQYSTTFAS